MAESDPPDFENWSCPLPLRGHDRVVIGHGGGGRLSGELVEHLFRPAFATSGAALGELHDAATLALDGGAGRLAFSTDSYVVRPLFFPGGSIGELAVHGTINDVSMSGAQPIALSCGFIIEEGLELATLGRIADRMGDAARAAGVPIVTGDTKVVDARLADGVYVNTAGVGVVPDGVDIRPSRATPGDVLVVSGPIGLHGVAVMSQREGLEFGTQIESDSAPLHGLVGAMLDAHRDLHVLRDPTRGGVAASLCEIASSAAVGVEYDEAAIPVPPEVAAACSFLGLDPMNVANEGKLVAFVPPEGVDAVVAAMHDHEHGRGARVIGRVVADHPGVVVARTRLGASRVVDLPLGEQLPRIC
ncbi:MAG: hydrogenase expression/formation protein HypE [Acidimicrobiaceae bacterium]|nr:hydrogenase expression/formation protein HypE [Acidimicrobiaceae bacterium]